MLPQDPTDKKVTWPGGFKAALERANPQPPQGASTDDELYDEYLYQQYLKRQRVAPKNTDVPRVEPAAEPTVGEALTYGAKSVARGAVEGVASSMTGAIGLGGLLGQLGRGGEQVGPAGVTPVDATGAAARRQIEFSKQYAPDRDPRFAGTLTESVGEGLGSAAAFAAGGFATGGAPVLGISALGVASSFSSGYFDALEQTGDEALAFEAGFLNAPAGLLESVPLAGQVGRVLGRANKATGGGLARVFVRAVAEGGENAAQEVLQRGIKDVIAKYGLAYDADREILVDALRQDALPAFIVGSVLSGLSSIGGLPPDVEAKYGVQNAPPEQAEELRILLRAQEAREQMPQMSSPPMVGEAATETASAQPVAPQEPTLAQAAQVAPGSPLVVPVAQAAPEAQAQPAQPQVAPAPAGAPPTIQAPQGFATGMAPPPVDGRPAPAQAQQAAPQAVPGVAAPAAAQAPAQPTRTQGTTAEPAAPDESATGIKNETVRAELEKMGLEYPEKAEPRSFDELWAKAKAEFDASNGTAGAELVVKLEAAPRIVDDYENMLLAMEARRLIEARGHAEEQFNLAPSKEGKAAVDAAQEAYMRAAKVFDAVGTESGRSLNARKIMLREDYSLAAVERRAAVANAGFPLSAEQRAEVSARVAELEAANKKLEQAQAEAETKAAALEAENAILRMKKNVARRERVGKRQQQIEASKKRIDQLIAEFNSVARSPSANPFTNPKLPSIALQLAVEHIKLGGVSLAQFTDKMVGALGEEARPFLQTAWAKAQQMQREEMSEKMRAAASTGKALGTQARGIRLIAEDFISQGIDTRDELVDAVHGVVVQAFPDATKRDVQDAMSGYGQFRELSKAEAKKKFRDIRAQLQQVSKIQDLQAKLELKRTGVERDAPSAEVRRLTKEVERLKRQMGYKASGEHTLKGVEDSIRTRLQNQIQDLQDAIERKQPLPDRSGQKVTSPEIESLRAQLAIVREQYAAMFDPQEQQRDTNEVRLEKAIAEVQQSIDRGGEVDDPARRQGPPTEAVMRLRQQLDAMRQQLAEQRRGLGANEDQVNARLSRRIDEVQAALDRGGSPQGRQQRQGPMPESTVRLQQQLSEMNQELAQMRKSLGKRGDDPAAVRLRKRIEEVRRQISDGGRPADVARLQGPPTAEVNDLRQQLNALSRDLAEVRRKNPERRSFAAIAATERAIADYEKRIATVKEGGALTKESKPEIVNAELDALRARRDALREELSQLREMQGPEMSQDMRDLRDYKKRKANELAKLQERIFYGEFGEDPRPTQRLAREVKLDDEGVARQVAVDAAKRKLDALVRRYENENRTRVQAAWDRVKAMNHLVGQVKSTYDLSAVLNQGGFFSIGHPVRMARDWMPLMFKSAKSDEVALRIEKSLRDDPVVQIGLRHGLDLPDMQGEVSEREEGLRSKLAERIPGPLGAGIRASNRMFATFLMVQRADMFRSMYLGAPTTPTGDEAHVLAMASNIASGRGETVKYKQHLKSAGEILWAPRLWLSRLQLLAGYPIYAKGNSPMTRRIIAAEYARYFTGMAAVYAAWTMYGLLMDDDDIRVGTDPLSGDLGKLIDGRTRMDPLSGLSQNIVLLARMMASAMTSSSGKRTETNKAGDFKGEDDLTLTFKIIRNKFHPTLGTYVNWKTREDPIGREFTLKDVPGALVEPLSVDNVVDLMQEHGVTKGTAYSMLALLGWSAQVHEEQQRRKR